MPLRTCTVTFTDTNGAKIDVQVREPATTHTVTLTQIQAWISGATPSPAERVRKDRLRAILAGK
jgi:hypothetical protein